MPGGIQRTPLDTIDLGGQLLEALVQAHRTKTDQASLKLEQDKLAHQENQTKLEALRYADPSQPAANDLLSQLTGQPGLQMQVPIEQRAFMQRQEAIKSLDPKSKEIFDRMELWKSPLPATDLVDVAKITGGMMPSVGQRADFFANVLHDIGSPALPAFNAAIGRDMGVQIPPGTKTLGEQQVATGQKLADAQIGEADARKMAAKTDFMQYMTGGFVKSNPQVSDEQFHSAMDEVFQVATDKRPFLSASAMAAITPVSKVAALAKAAGEPPPGFEQDLAIIKALTEAANLGKKPTKESLAFLQGKLAEFVQKYPMVSQGPTPPTSSSSADQGSNVDWLTGPAAAMFGIASGDVADSVTLTDATGQKRPLNPTVAAALKSALKGVARSTGPTGMIMSVADDVLRGLDKAYQKVLPMITTEPGKPPVVAPTLGPLASPSAGDIPPEMKQKLQGLVAAYRAAGGTADEASAIEGELLQVMKSGDAKAQKEYIQALLEDIDQMKVSGTMVPAE